MATSGQLLARMARGETLLESEIMQLERALDGYDRAGIYVDSIQTGSGKINAQEIRAKLLDSDVPVTRAITFNTATNLTGLADNVPRDLAFSAHRGYIRQSDACVIYKPGSTDKFIRNPAIPSNRSIYMIAAVIFPPASGTIESAMDVFFDFYEGGSYTGSFSAYANWHRWFVEYTTVTVVGHKPLADNEEVRVNVVQWNSGISLNLFSAEATFMLG